MGAKQLAEGNALNEVHDEEAEVVGLAHAVDVNDRGVAHRSDRAGFPFESLEHGLVREPCGREYLDRDKSIEAELTGEVDRAHASRAQLADDRVVASSRGSAF